MVAFTFLITFCRLHQCVLAFLVALGKRIFNFMEITSRHMHCFHHSHNIRMATSSYTPWQKQCHQHGNIFIEDAFSTSSTYTCMTSSCSLTHGKIIAHAWQLEFSLSAHFNFQHLDIIIAACRHLHHTHAWQFQFTHTWQDHNTCMEN